MRRVWYALLGAAATASCELPKEFLEPGTPTLVVHGVLNGSATPQYVLLERTLTGSRYVLSPPFTPGDPITTDGGIPEENATVRIEAPDGQTYGGAEFAPATAPKIAGVYVVQLPGSALVPGGVYRLTVTTTKGEQLSAETRIPGSAPAATSPSRAFDRSSDTANVQWNAVPGARAYAVRIEGPFGAYMMMTASTHLRLTGNLRNLDGDGFPRVFIPGFRQAVSISAIDSNYYDYYRSGMEFSTGAGLVSRVQGGIGFFGSLMRVFVQTFDVTAPEIEPVDGTFDRIIDPQTSNYFAREVTIRMESRAARSDQGDAITGNYRLTPTAPLAGILGTNLRDSVTLVFLSDQLAVDTAEVWRGRLRGDTLDGKFSKGAVAKFLKR